MYEFARSYLGGYSDQDGTVEFFSRIQSVTTSAASVLDLGAGRGNWYEDDACYWRRELRSFRGKVARYVGADVDPVVLNNRSTDENVHLTSNILPFPDSSFDVVFADYVLEHLAEPAAFAREVARVLKPQGIFAARTPHSLNYVSLAARCASLASHKTLLRWIQPGRKPEDVFETHYRVNSIGVLKKVFVPEGFDDYSYIYRVEPSYYFGSKLVFELQSLLIACFQPSHSGTSMFSCESSKQ